MSDNLFVSVVALPAAMSLAITLSLTAVERWRPATKQGWASLALNLKHLIPYFGLHLFTVPLAIIATVWLINRLGGGLIVIPESGLGLLLGIVGFTLASDFAEFAFHVAQHKIPALWAMHSLHHSDPELNASTTQRHFWAEQAIKTLTVYVPIGLLFHANAIVFSVYGFITFYNYFNHMNVRVSLGRFSWVINSPHYHRHHHSSLPEDRDKRFAGIFPIFDVIFGFYEIPRADGYPPTGLDDGAHPNDVVEATLWPARKLLRAKRQQ